MSIDMSVLICLLQVEGVVEGKFELEYLLLEGSSSSWCRFYGNEIVDI